MKDEIESSISLLGGLVVIGGLISLPSNLCEFPANIVLWPLQLYPAWLIVRIETERKMKFKLLNTVLLAASSWIGFAAVFHIVHGAWDYQGVPIVFVGTIMSYSALTVMRKLNDKALKVIDPNQSGEGQ